MQCGNRRRDLQLQCNESNPLTNWTACGSSSSSGLAYIAGLSALGKAQVTVCLAVSSIGACLYAIRIGTMVHRRLPYSSVTLASALIAMFPVYEALLCLAILVPKSAEFMHVLMAAYSMIVFNDLANLLTVKFGAIRFVLGRRCLVVGGVSDSGGGGGGRGAGGGMTVTRSKPPWSRSRLLATRALIRQGKLLHCLNVALSAALQLDEAPATSQPPPPPSIGDPLQWLRGVTAASRVAASAAAVALVARCCRGRRGSNSGGGGGGGGGGGSGGCLMPGYRLGAKFSALAAVNAAHWALGTAACAATWAGVGVAEDTELHAQFALLLLAAACQVWSLGQFGWWTPLPTAAAAAASVADAEADTAGSRKPQPTRSQRPQPALTDLSPSAIVDDSVPGAVRRGAGHCASCRRLAMLASSESHDLGSTRLLEY